MRQEYEALNSTDEASVASRYFEPVSSILSTVTAFSESGANGARRLRKASWDPLGATLEFKSEPRAKPLSTEQRRKITSNLVCGICIDDLDSKESFMIWSCGHRFHRDCLEKWKRIKATCPYCRAKISGGPSTEVKQDQDQVPVHNIPDDEAIDNLRQQLREWLEEFPRRYREVQQLREVLDVAEQVEQKDEEDLRPIFPVVEEGQCGCNFRWSSLLLSPIGIFVPPILLVLMWSAEIFLFLVLIVLSAYCSVTYVYGEARIRSSNCCGFLFYCVGYSILVPLASPFCLVLAILMWVGHIYHSLGLACLFYIQVLVGEYTWTEADVICRKSFVFPRAVHGYIFGDNNQVHGRF